MITQLVGAITKDVLFAQKNKGLPKDYPAPIRSYLKDVSDEVFLQDLSPVLELLAENTSVIAAAVRLMKEQNAYVVAVLDALPELKAYSGTSTELGVYLTSINEAGAQYQQTLVREMQSFLLHATHVDSPLIQVASPLEEDSLTGRDLPGVPQIATNRSLIGGARMFLDGSVRDDSWRARLTKILSAVTNV